MATMDAAPWLALAGAGALHGLNPAGGWLLAAGCLGRPAPHAARPAWRRLLVPMAAGHLAAVALLAALVAWNPGSARLPLPLMALLVLPAGAALAAAIAGQRRGAGLALGSYIGATLQGAGLMLVPALAPLCVGDGPARTITASGSAGLALAAVVVHGAAMLATTAGIAAVAQRGVQRWRRAAPHPIAECKEIA